MRKIRIVFSRPNRWKPFAQLIMWADRKLYSPGEQKKSHAAIKFPRETRLSLYYQASGHSVNFMGEPNFYSKNIVAEEYELELTEEQHKKAVDFCVEREGTPYPIKQTLGKAVAYLFEVFGKTIKNPWKQYEDCVEVAASFLAAAKGIQVPLDMDTVRVKKFNNWVKTIPGIVRIK